MATNRRRQYVDAVRVNNVSFEPEEKERICAIMQGIGRLLAQSYEDYVTQQTPSGITSLTKCGIVHVVTAYRCEGKRTQEAAFQTLLAHTYMTGEEVPSSGSGLSLEAKSNHPALKIPEWLITLDNEVKDVTTGAYGA